MKEKYLIQLIDESIRLELNAAELYRIFHDAHPEDANFWWQLHLEEKSHAMLLKAAKVSFLKRGKFPEDLLADSVNELRANNERIEKMTATLKIKPPTRLEAYQIALEVEKSCGETHFSHFMKKDSDSPIDMVLRQLNTEDHAHHTSIRERLEELT